MLVLPPTLTTLAASKSLWRNVVRVTQHTVAISTTEVECVAIVLAPTIVLAAKVAVASKAIQDAVELTVRGVVVAQ